jgi:hypothetical protein
VDLVLDGSGTAYFRSRSPYCVFAAQTGAYLLLHGSLGKVLELFIEFLSQLFLPEQSAYPLNELSKEIHVISPFTLP